MRAVCFRFFRFSFFSFFSLNLFILPAESVWIGLINFHYYSFRVFSHRGVSALASNPKRGCFVTLHSCAVLKDRGLRYKTVFNLKHNWYDLHARRSRRLFFKNV